MKKLAISTLAVLIACPAFAGMGNPNQGSSWQLWGMNPYVGLRVGAGFDNLNYKYNGHKESLTDEVFQGRAAIGLELCKKVRSEVEWSIFSKAKDSADFGTANDIKVDTKLQTVMWNSYMEFGSYKIVRPFIGAGVGMAFAEIKRDVPGVGHKTHDNTRVSAMATMGVTFDMERFAVDLAARYNYIDVASGLHNFSGDVGIRFMF